MTRQPDASTTAPTPDGGAVPVDVYLPSGGTGPGVLLVQEIFGVSDYVRQRARDLADAGYVVHVPHLYWRLGADGDLPEDAPDLLPRAMATAQQLPPATAVADTAATLHALRDSPAVTGGVGLLGFCWGGSIAFSTAAQERVEALVSFYGSMLPAQTDLAPQVTAPSQHHFGEADSFIPLDQVTTVQAAVRSTGAVSEFHLYPGAGHAFDNPRPEFHHPEASQLAWDRTLGFLAQHLQG